MAQTTILATGTDATPSSEFNVGPAERAKVTLFPATGSHDQNASAAVYKKAVRPAGWGTPSHNSLAGDGTPTQIVAILGSGVDTNRLPVIWLAEPGTYYVTRTQGGSPAAFGVYVDVTSRYSG